MPLTLISCGRDRASAGYASAMTFRGDAQFDTTQVRRRGGGARGGAIALGGGGLITVLLFVVSSFLGIDLTGLGSAIQQDPSAGSGSDTEVVGCTGEQANDPANYQCRMEGGADSLSAYWTGVFAQNSLDYREPTVVLYSAQVATACGNASSAVGPFYCPGDEQIYIDETFFDQMRTRFGASGGSLSQLYVLAHEWGHHVQQLTGDLQRVNHQDTGPSGSAVRSELQADCYAGAWIAAASTTEDQGGGDPVLVAPTQAELNDALDAAAAIGDDNLQQQSGQGVNPDSWTHGSSEQRQTWFANGYRDGVSACAAVWQVPTP